MTLRQLAILCCATGALSLTGCAAGPAALISPLAASALKNLPPFNNSPAALAAATGSTGNTGTTIVKGKTATVIIKNGKTTVIPHRHVNQ